MSRFLWSWTAVLCACGGQGVLLEPQAPQTSQPPQVPQTPQTPQLPEVGFAQEPPAVLRAEPRVLPLALGTGNVVDVEVNEKGEVLVLWRAHPDLFAQLYDKNGQPLTEVLLVHTEPRAGPHADATFLKGGSFVVVYGDALGTPTNLWLAVRMRRYDATGLPSPEETVDDNLSRPTVAALDDGGYVVVTQRYENQTGASQLRAYRYTASGAPIRARSALGLEGAYPRVWATREGGYMVSFSQERQGDSATVLRYDASDQALGRPATFDLRVDSMLMLPDDSLMILSQGIVKRFALDGSALSRGFEVGSSEGFGELTQSGCALGRCQLTAVWRERSSISLVGRMFDPLGQPIINPISQDTGTFEVAPEGVPPTRERPYGRTGYGDVKVSGGPNGGFAFIWTAWDLVEQRGTEFNLEGLLIMP